MLDLEFFDPTKSFGFSADERVQFPAAADLLRELGRQGIARALVFHHEAAAFHPASGNRRLLADIGSTPFVASSIAQRFNFTFYRGGTIAAIAAAILI